MQEQNLEEWKEKIDRSAEQITVPDTLTPGAVQQMLEERKNRTSAGRKEHRHYRRFAGIAAAVAVLVIAVGTYGWNKYGTDDAQPKKAALSVTETVDSTQDTEKKEQIGAFTLAKSYQDVYAAVQKKSNSQKELAEGTVDDLFFVEDTGSAEAKKESSGTHSDTNLQVNGVDEGDIVKNDGNYLYVLNDDRVTIVDIRDKNMRKLSEIRPELTENDILLQLYVDNDRLYVIKQGWETQQEEIQSDSTEADNDSGFIGCYKDIAYEPDGNVSTVLLTYDISERANPVLSATMKMDGAYQSSRKVGNFIYLFTDRWVSRDGKNWKAQVIPEIAGKKADAGCFYVQKNGTTEVIMASVNLKEPSADRVPEDTKKELTAQVRQLSNEHSDSVAWLYIPGTNIDYPVMQSEDNEYYAHRAADGSYLYAGSLFMDYRNSSDFTDFNSVIYGHNMGNGTMFADIPHYENEEYFMNHSYGWLTTEDEVWLIDFFAVARTADTSGLYLADPSFEEWDTQLRNSASIYKEIGISANDNLIMLSTCTSAEGNSRTILVGKIIDNREDDAE